MSKVISFVFLLNHILSLFPPRIQPSPCIQVRLKKLNLLSGTKLMSFTNTFLIWFPDVSQKILGMSLVSVMFSMIIPSGLSLCSAFTIPGSMVSCVLMPQCQQSKHLDHSAICKLGEVPFPQHLLMTTHHHFCPNNHQLQGIPIPFCCCWSQFPTTPAAPCSLPSLLPVAWNQAVTNVHSQTLTIYSLTGVPP